MDNFDWGELLMGALVMAVLWIISAGVVEEAKVQNGYLTYNSKVYLVTLYSKPIPAKIPPKPEEVK